MRIARPLAWVLLAAAAASVAPAAAATQSGQEALLATVEVERALFKEDQEKHERMAGARAGAAARLADLYAALDGALKREAGAPAGAIEDAMQAVEAAERERSQLLAEELALVERIRERARKIALLEERVVTLEAKAETSAGPLSARWDVTLLPLGQRGVFTLMQTGTLVSGTYVLDGGWSGSLEGTLVNRKVYLQRIDSKLGHSADYEGYLSAEGDRIRGTWSSYDVTAQGGSTGQWSAVRRASAP